MAYINKEDLLATINEVWERKYARCEWKTLYDLYRMCIRRINRAQVADVDEVKHGEWIHPLTDEPWNPGVFGKCSRCGYVCSHIKKMPMFCENCGAKMDGDK